MIIQCVQCSSKFRLDDSKVTEAGIKVRCSKCRHIFVVRKESPVEEHDLDQILEGLGTPGSAAASPAAPDVAPVFAAGAAGAIAGAVAASTVEEDDFSSFAAEKEEEPAVEDGNAAGDVLAASFPPVEDVEIGQTFVPPVPDFGSFEEVPVGAAGVEEPELPAFGEVSGGVEMADEHEQPPVFEQEIVFGDVSAEAFAAATEVAPATTEDGEEPDITFEFEDDTAGGEALVPAEKGDESFDFGEIDFGIDDVETAESPTEKTAALDFSLGDADKARPEAVPPSLPAEPEEVFVPPVAVPFGDEELPPLSISSRRKGQSFLPGAVIGVSVLAIVALAGGGFYFFKEGPAALDKLGIGFVAGWFGVETREEGSIGLDKVKGAYLTNAEAGEVFVVRGEAVNNYRKPRASIQVKGALLGQGGQVLAQKIAYCGNSLTDEQIRTLPMAKIDAAMNNQFGDSLANLGVQPGRRIPFVVVLSKVPREAVDFGVEVVGSTVASQ